MNRIFATVFCAFVLALPGFQAGAAELDPKAVVHQLPDQIKWSPVNPAGAQGVTLEPGEPVVALVFPVPAFVGIGDFHRHHVFRILEA
jgi:hypothetical protein